MNYEGIVEPLEARMRVTLEVPDEARTELSRRLILAPYYHMDAFLTGARTRGSFDEGHELFLFGPNGPVNLTSPPEGLPSDFTLGALPFFSCVYGHSEGKVGKRIYGTSQPPPEEKATMLVDTIPPTEEGLALLALAHQFWKAIPHNGGYELNDQEYREAGIDIGKFVTLINTFVASGTFVRNHRTQRLDSRNGLYVDLGERSVTKGSSPDAVMWDIIYPDIYMNVIEGGVEHCYNRSNGVVEVKTRIADASVRYADLESFRAFYDEDGTIIHWTCDQDEIYAIEDAERAIGLYVPSAESLQPFHDALDNLPDPA